MLLSISSEDALANQILLRRISICRKVYEKHVIGSLQRRARYMCAEQGERGQWPAICSYETILELFIEHKNNTLTFYG